MAHQLDFIESNHILQAILSINKTGIPKDNQWSEYWITHGGKSYQFKYVVEVASSFTSNYIKTNDFTSNDSSRNYIASLGFQIIYKSLTVNNIQTNYWVGASYYRPNEDPINMFDEFINNNYWATDHDLEGGEGLNVYHELEKVQINDRICIRYLDRKGSTVQVAAIGTVSGISNIEEGKLEVVWDYNAPKYKGTKPSGTGAGNWWRTLFQLKRHEDVELIFGTAKIERRVSRVTWNDFGWVMPSGPFGKSKNTDTHEGKYGFGHEEWLFDTSKIIDEFHYAFLEPIYKSQNTYSGKSYDVWLYSINGDTQKRFWAGEIKNLIVIDEEEAEIVKKKYIENGWLKEMEAQIKVANANPKGFLNSNAISLFNIKFRPSDLLADNPYFELPKSHPINEQTRYNFGHFKSEHSLLVESKPDGLDFIQSPDILEENDNNDIEINKYYRQPKPIEIVYLHKQISKSLTKELKRQYGSDKVTSEHPAGYGANKIDIVVQHEDFKTFYEIKTYNSLKTSIREALGQLMEYCFFPDKKKAQELIIVSQKEADEDTIAYFKHLRITFNLNIYYQSYDFKTNELSIKW